MLRLQVRAPVHPVLEPVVVLFQDLHRLGVADPGEIGGGHVLQPGLEALIHEAVEEVDLIRAALQHPGDDVLDHGLGNVHITGQVAEGHLRLDHPELGGVALGVGVLGPEGGAEGIHIAEGHGEVLGVQLAGHGEAGFLAEEILAVVHLALRGLGHIVQVQGGHLEHLACALAVGPGDDGGVDIHKAPALEELMHGIGRRAANPEGSGKQIGPGTQMLDGPQEFHAVALFLQGIVGGGPALHGDLGSPQLQGLLGLRRQHHGAPDDQGRAHVLSRDFLIIMQFIGAHDHLQIAEAGAVVELDEAEGLHIPDGAGPAAHGDLLAAQLLLVGKDGCDFHAIHLDLSL